MDARSFNRQAKILLTELSAGHDVEKNREKYIKMMASALSGYSMMKVVLNYFTRREMHAEDRREEDNPAAGAEDYREDFREEYKEEELLRAGIAAYTSTESLPDEGFAAKHIEELTGLRDRTIRRMETCTYFTEALTPYEAVLERKRSLLSDEELLPADPETLLQELERFIFQDNDKMVVNTRIQWIISELPVRMTKQRFYDILSESLALYKGGELSAAEDFVRRIMDTAGISISRDEDLAARAGEKKELSSLVSRLDRTVFKDLAYDETLELRGAVDRAAGVLRLTVTDLVEFEELLNDLLILFYAGPYADEEYLTDRFAAAKELLGKIAALSPEEELTAGNYDEGLANLEGAQEEIYEGLLILEGQLDQLAGDLPPVAANALRTADILTSTSVFIDISKMLRLSDADRVMADEDSIGKLKASLEEAFDQLFAGLEKEKKKQIMACVLGCLPVFFNSRDEIGEYFRYTLSGLKDRELAVTAELLRGLMME